LIVVRVTPIGGARVPLLGSRGSKVSERVLWDLRIEELVDGSGRYIEEDFVVQRIRDATELLREVKSAILEGNPDGLAEEELDVDVRGNAVAIREELLDVLKRALEKARQEGRGGRDGGDK